MSVSLISLFKANRIASKYGDFLADGFVVEGTELTVLRTEGIPGQQNDVTCRIQFECMNQSFFDRGCDCADQMEASLKRIQAANSGLVILLRQPAMHIGKAGDLLKFSQDETIYAAAVPILKHYGIRSIKLLSGNNLKAKILTEAGIDVRHKDWPEGRLIFLGPKMRRAVFGVGNGHVHPPIKCEESMKVLVLGDLNVDISKGTDPKPGGSGYNAALAFKNTPNFAPIIFGKVGRDPHGTVIEEAIQKQGIHCLLGIHEKKLTGRVRITNIDTHGAKFDYVWDKVNNANDYDADDLQQAIVLSGVGENDYIFISSYLFVQKLFDPTDIKAIFRILSNTRANLILDFARKSFYYNVLADCGVNGFDSDNLLNLISDISLYAVVGEMSTFDTLNLVEGAGRPERSQMKELLTTLHSKWIVCRYVEGGTLKQRYARLSREDVTVLQGEDVGSASTLEIGQGDKKTAVLLKNMREHDDLNS